MLGESPYRNAAINAHSSSLKDHTDGRDDEPVADNHTTYAVTSRAGGLEGLQPSKKTIFSRAIWRRSRQIAREIVNLGEVAPPQIAPSESPNYSDMRPMV